MKKNIQALFLLVIAASVQTAYAACELDTAFQFASKLDCPKDVEAFFIANDSCAHFAGEPYEGVPDREKFLRDQMNSLGCKQLLDNLVGLVKKYRDDPKVMQVMQEYDAYMYGPPTAGDVVDNPDAPEPDPNDPLTYPEPTLGAARTIIKYQD